MLRIAWAGKQLNVCIFLDGRDIHSFRHANTIDLPLNQFLPLFASMAKKKKKKKKIFPISNFKSNL